MLSTQKPERCYIKSRTHYPEDKLNVNNILIMSSFLHQRFDGINQYEGVPDFANPSTIICPIGGGRQIEFYEVCIRVVFLGEYQRDVLTPYSKDSMRIGGLEEIELNLYATDHQEFKEFLDHKHQNTLRKWASLAGPVG